MNFSEGVDTPESVPLFGLSTDIDNLADVGNHPLVLAAPQSVMLTSGDVGGPATYSFWHSTRFTICCLLMTANLICCELLCV